MKTNITYNEYCSSLKKQYGTFSFTSHYSHCFFLYSLYSTASKNNDIDTVNWVKTRVETFITEEGHILSYNMEDYNLDNLLLGNLLFSLFENSSDKKYLKACETLISQLNTQPKTINNCYWHKKSLSKQIWINETYMYVPFALKYYMYINDTDKVSFVIEQFKCMTKKLTDSNTGLLYHAWDETKHQLWANPETGCSQIFWGRGIGWYCLALSECLTFLFDKDSFKQEYEYFLGITLQLQKLLCNYQDKSGLWYQVIDQPTRVNNYLESSCTAMFSYFLSSTANYTKNNIENLLLSAQKAVSGISQLMIEQIDDIYHLNGICSFASLGGTPYRDGSYLSYVQEKIISDDFKGISPLLLALNSIDITKKA